MSSLFGLAQEVLSAAPGFQSGQKISTTGGALYNSPQHTRQPQAGFDTQTVLSHAGDIDEESKGHIATAIQHVHDNPDQHQHQVDEGDLTKYAPMIFSALSSLTKSGGGNLSSLVSGGLGEGGGNQLMGLVLKQVGSAMTGSSSQDKQSLMNGAAMTLTKLVAQKQLSGFIGGSNSGGLSSMINVGESLFKNRFG